MLGVALKMLMGDRVKYFGLIFGIAFATLLMTQQVSIFAGLLAWGANPVLDVREAQVWVMDKRVRQAEEGLAISDAELYRVRSVDGVDWAVPYFRATTTLKTADGTVNALTLIGVDNASLVGLPPDNRAAAAEAIRGRNALVLDRTLVGRIWKDGRNPVGEVIEINDNRVTVAALTDSLPTFSGLPVGYMKFTDAITITPPERNKLSFVLARAKAGAFGGAGSDESSGARRSRNGSSANAGPQAIIVRLQRTVAAVPK
ncbi:MAG: hypothetical protein EBZ50_01425 [Alphaproteobacteria bacterium]|nr:hypothetical protein [Alphaproteobacteria bacterium]